jgi:hypothetical protein
LKGSGRSLDNEPGNQKENIFVLERRRKKKHASMNFPEQDERQARIGPECERLQVKKLTTVFSSIAE